LKWPDKVPDDAAVGPEPLFDGCPFFRQFVGPVLAEVAYAKLVGGDDDVGRERLGHGHQRELARVTARAGGRFGNPGLYVFITRGDVFTRGNHGFYYTRLSSSTRIGPALFST